jgi:hypothetical protein
LFLSVGTVATILQYYLDRNGLGLSATYLDSAYSGLWLKMAVLMVAVVLGLYLLFRVAKLIPTASPSLRRHPVLWFHAAVIAYFVVTPFIPPLAAFAELLLWLVWRVGYMFQLAQRGQANDTKFTDHLFHLWPIYPPTAMPYGEGLEYLARCEAKDEPSEALSRLAGLKLLLLATVWEFVLREFDGVFYLQTAGDGLNPYNLGLPTLEQAIIAGDATTGLAWLTILLHFFRTVLFFAVIMHPVVGVIRLAGFNIFRGLYKPLLAESIVDFWGKFNYYFKKLMTEFFFYPTLLLAKKLGPRSRMFVAVFASASIGNMYLHLFYSYEQLVTAEYGLVWDFWGPRVVYSSLLALGIWVSMLRQQQSRQKRTEKPAWVRVRAVLGVWVFYSIISIWNQGWDQYGYDLDWSNRFAFTLKLIGLDV